MLRLRVSLCRGYIFGVATSFEMNSATLPGAVLDKSAARGSYVASSRLGASEEMLLKKFAKEVGISCSQLTRRLLVAKLLELDGGKA